jgi:pimeloyl-ACP methyl ester carboxylesterase
MPGFGDSDLGDADSPQGWGQIVEELADRLDLERFSLLAHSLGGGAAMLLAHRLPARVERLVLLCSMGVSPHQLFRQTPPEAFRELAAALSAADSRAGVVEMMRGFYASAGFEAPSDWRRLQRQLELGASTDFPSLRRAASEIKAPTTIIQTVDDPHLELELARELAQIISGSQLVELSHGGHYPQRTHPREVAQLLTTALR